MPQDKQLKPNGSQEMLRTHDSTTLVPQEKRNAPLVEPKSEEPKASTTNNFNLPPDGGIQAWLQVLGGFMLFFNTWGFLNTFGVFQTYYESGTLFTESSSNISWIGSLQSYFIFMIGFISGPIYDRGYFRTLIVTGSFGIVFGLMMLSICETYWQVLLAQGFVLGIGMGCLFVPCVAILPGYFSSRIGLAIGIAASGSSLGGIIYPITLYRLIDLIGFGWAVRVIGFIALGTLLIPITLMRVRVKPPKARALIDWTAFTDIHFILFTSATFIGFMGLYSMLIYLSFFGESTGILDRSLAFYIVPIFNAASCFGRIVPNWISDKTGAINLIAPGAIILGILNLCMLAVHTKGGLITAALFSGFFSGIFIALPAACFVALTQDKSKIGTRMGMGFGLIGFSVLIGGPGCGAILGTVDPLNWTGLWVFGGVCACASGVMFGILRVVKAGPKLMVKV